MKAQVWLEAPEAEKQGHNDDVAGLQDDEVDMIKLEPKIEKRTYGRGAVSRGAGRCSILLQTNTANEG